MKHIVSFSGGKDSTRLLLLMVENNYKIDDIVFFDTGWEFIEMYEHIKKVERYINRKITFVYPIKSFDYYFSEFRKKKGNNINKVGYSWPDYRNRWCTRYKINAIKKYCNNLGDHIIYEGIAFDEQHRMKPNKIYLLIENEITEKMALKYCYSKGFDWGGLYEIFLRVSCRICPLKRIGELRNIYKYKPEIWNELIQKDQNTWRQFRNDYSIQELTDRFCNEIKSK